MPLKVTLSNGDSCGLLLGTTITVPVNGEEQRVNYGCVSGGVLIGLPQQEGGVWVITHTYQAKKSPHLKLIKAEKFEASWHSC